MNLLEHYIIEVHGVETIEKPWGSFILVDMTYNCHGHISRDKRSFLNEEEWEHAQEVGYFEA